MLTDPRPRTTDTALGSPRAARAVVYVVLTLAVAATLLPFVWMALGSVKTQRELLQRPPTWWPQTFTWENFGAWFGELGIQQFLTNSLVVAVVTVLGNLLFCAVITGIGYLQFFEEPFVMTQGGPLDKTLSVAFYIYNQFGFGNYGYAASVSYLIFIVIAIITAIQFRLLRENR